MSTCDLIHEKKRSIFISDESESYDVSLFALPRHYTESVKNILIPHGLIIDRVEKMAVDILNAYSNKTVHLMCVLKGGSIFFSDLMQALNKRFCNLERDYIPYTFDFIKVSSYEGTESTGKVKVHMDHTALEALNGKDVLFVEDIIDTGLSMVKLLEYFGENAKCPSLATATLLEKRTHRSNGFRADFIGFSIPDHFVIGYGLDYNEKFRDMSHICVISDDGIEKYKV